MKDLLFISRERVEWLHQRSLSAHGGQDGIRDEHALESALAQPMQAYHYGQGDLYDIAATYAFHLAENQPFIDGNKRTAIMTALAFLSANGAPVASLTDDWLYAAMIGISARQVDKAGLAALFRQQG